MNFVLLFFVIAGGLGGEIEGSKGWLWYIKKDTTKQIIDTTAKARADSIIKNAPKWTKEKEPEHLKKEPFTLYGPERHFKEAPQDTDFSDVPIVDADKLPQPVVQFLMYPTPENAKKFLAFYQRLQERGQAMYNALRQAILTEGIYLSPSTPLADFANASYVADMRDSILNDMKKHCILVYFFSTRCHFCAQETPIMEALFEEGYQVLGIYPPSQKGEIKSYRERFGIAFPLKPDGGEAVTFNINSVPAVGVLVDKGNAQEDEFYIIARGVTSISDIKRLLIDVHRKAFKPVKTYKKIKSYSLGGKNHESSG